MGQIKILKIGSEGVPTEHASADDLSFNSFTAALAGGFAVTSGVTITNNISFNAVSDTVGGIQNQNLLDKTDNESITGNWSLGVSGELDATLGEFTFPNAVSAVPAAGDSYWDGDTLYAYDAVGAAWLPIGGVGGFVSNLDVQYTADENITTGKAVYVSANDNVTKAKADSNTTDKVIGFTTTTVLDTNSVYVRESGIIPGVLTGATAGDRYYLSAATAGVVTATAPTASGSRVIQVGFAKNATDLNINIQFMGIRS